MTTRFATQHERYGLRVSLLRIVVDMVRSRDQGHNGTIYVTDSMIADIARAADIMSDVECDDYSN